MVLGMVVGQVIGSGGPVEAKLRLGFTAAEPMEAEPNHFSAPLDNSVMQESSGGGVVSLKW